MFLLTNKISRRRSWLPATGFLVGCQLILNVSEDDFKEQTEERCKDNIDNDENGLFDCGEPLCQGFNSCIQTCGDGIVDSGEACDDGNQIDLDGCDALCQLECGNGTVDVGEICDDSNTTNGDGCNSVCQIDCNGAFGANSAVFDASVNSCYLFFTTALSWQSAQTDCVAKGGGHLAVFDTIEENNLAQTLNINDIEIWIGYNDLLVESNNIPAQFIKVTDNLPIGNSGFENFDAVNPQGGELEDCVAINDLVGGQWRDSDCVALKTYLCELEF